MDEQSRAGVLPTLGLLGKEGLEGLIDALTLPLGDFEILNTVTYPHCVGLKSPLSQYCGKEP